MKLTPEKLEELKRKVQTLADYHQFELIDIREDDIMGAVVQVRVHNIVVNQGNHGTHIGYTFTRDAANTLKEMLENFLGNRYVAKEFSVDIDSVKDTIYLNPEMVDVMMEKLGRV